MFILRSWWIEINLWDTAGAFSRVGRNGTTKVFKANDPKTGVLSLSWAEASARYPNKNNNNWKIDSARGTMGRGEKWASLPLFSLPIVPARFLFSLSPATLRHKEASEAVSQKRKMIRGQMGTSII